ncbi:holo-[acyl-carrier-protein] synthase [Streptacidiphilus sp. 4-A2]|nr:holo-[acyl-carrier-protein] synthase [Streptacidiphilus sp. 4-A2]
MPPEAIGVPRTAVPRDAPAPDPASGLEPGPAPGLGDSYRGDIGTALRVLIGTDLVAVARVAELLTGQPELAERIFTARELAYCASRGRRRAEHLAARFAAKEAVLKALGTGAAAGVEWTDVEVVNGIGGRPDLRLHGRAAALARRRGVRQAEISLTHTAGLAAANAMLLCATGTAVRILSEKGAKR